VNDAIEAGINCSRLPGAARAGAAALPAGVYAASADVRWWDERRGGPRVKQAAGVVARASSKECASDETQSVLVTSGCEAEADLVVLERGLHCDGRTERTRESLSN